MLRSTAIENKITFRLSPLCRENGASGAIFQSIEDFLNAFLFTLFSLAKNFIPLGDEKKNRIELCNTLYD